MKEKIFEKMEQYGWNLGNNTIKDFEEVYEIHYNFLQGLYDYFVETDEPNCSRDLNDIDEQRLQDMVDFMSDFVRAINDIDKYITKPYEDVLILDTNGDTQITKDLLIMNDRGRVGNESREEMLNEINTFLGTYHWKGMEIISYELAKKIFNNVAIYLLYDDNTEDKANSIEEMEEHYYNGGLFGVEV